jgi:hypothetical protein
VRGMSAFDKKPVLLGLVETDVALDPAFEHGQ